MGAKNSKFDDKDDEEFVNLDALPFYNDEFVSSLESKISGGANLESFDEFVQKYYQGASKSGANVATDRKALMTSLATLFTSKFEGLTSVKDFSCFNAPLDKNLANLFMRGRRNLLLDRVFQAQSNVLDNLRSLNDSAASKSGSGSIYWNLPELGKNAAMTDEATKATMMSLTMSLSLAQSLGAQNDVLLAAILKSILTNWVTFFAPLSFANSEAALKNVLTAFEAYAVQCTVTASHGKDVRGLAVSLLLVLGILQGSVSLITESALLLMEHNLLLDACVHPLLKVLVELEPDYELAFPEGLGAPERIPLSLESGEGDASEGGGASPGSTLCVGGAVVFIYESSPPALFKVSKGGRGQVIGEVLASNRDLGEIAGSNNISTLGENVYLHQADSSLFVFDAGTLAFRETVNIDLGRSAIDDSSEVLNYRFDISAGTESVLNLQAQDGYKMELIVAMLDDEKDVSDRIEACFSFNGTWLYCRTNELLSGDSTVATLTVALRMVQSKRKICQPMATLGSTSLVFIENLGGPRQVFSPLADVQFTSVSFVGGNEMTNEEKDAFLGKLKVLWAQYLSQIGTTGAYDNAELFQQQWQTVIAEYAPAQSAEPIPEGEEAAPAASAQLVLKAIFGGIGSEEVAFSFEDKANWNSLIEKIAAWLVSGDASLLALVVDVSTYAVTSSCLLLPSANGKIAPLACSRLEGSFLLSNGAHLLISSPLTSVDSEGTLIETWKYSFKDGQLLSFEADKFYTQNDGATFQTATFDPVSNVVYALNAASKQLLKWRNTGLTPPGGVLLSAWSSEQLGKLFASSVTQDQGFSILHVLERYGRAFTVSEGASGGKRKIMLEYRSQAGREVLETRIAVAGNTLKFDDCFSSDGIFLVILNEQFHVVRKVYYAIDNSDARDSFMEYVDRLPPNTLVLLAMTKMLSASLNRSFFLTLKSLGLRDLQHEKPDVLMAIGRKGLTPGMADFVTQPYSVPTTLARQIPPVNQPLVTQPTTNAINHLMTATQRCLDRSQSSAAWEEYLPALLNLLASNLRNLNSGLPVATALKVIGKANVSALRNLVNGLLASKFMSIAATQSTISALFSSSLDLLYSTTAEKIELLEKYAAEYQKSAATEGDSEILRLLMNNVASAKNYLISGPVAIDRAFTSNILKMCEGLLKFEMKKICADTNGLTRSAKQSKLFQKVVSVISATASSMLVVDLQSVSVENDKVTLARKSSMSIFLEVFRFLAKLSTDLISSTLAVYQQRVNSATVSTKEDINACKNDLFNFLEETPLATTLPAVVTAFVRLTTIGGYSFVQENVEEVLELVKETDSTMSGLTHVVSLLPPNAAKVSQTVPSAAVRKQTIESEHPYRSNMDERRVLFFPGNPSKLIVSFSETTRTETNCDYVLVLDRNGASLHPLIEKFTGRDGGDNWPGQKGRPPMELPGTSEVTVFFHSDGSVEDWGYELTITATYAAKAGGGARNRLAWIPQLTLDLVDAQSTLAACLVQGPALKPLESECVAWMKNPLVRPDYFSYSTSEDEVDTFLNGLVDRPAGSASEHLVQLMKKQVGEDQGNDESINRAVYSTCAAIIRANNLAAEAFALATGKKEIPSPAMIKAWSNGQKMREFFRIGDVKSGIQQKKAKFSLHAGASDEVLAEASKFIVERARFLLRSPKEKDLNQVENMRGTSGAGPSASSKWKLASRGILRQQSEQTRKAQEIWHNLVSETVTVDKLKNIFEHRRKVAEKNRTRANLTTTEKVLQFVQSDVEIQKLQDINHIRNKRAISRTKGLDMFIKLLSSLSAFPDLASTALERFSSALKPTGETAEALIHYSNDLEGSSPEQHSLLWQKHGELYHQCVNFIRDTYSQEDVIAQRALCYALKACAFDFDFADGNLVHESNLLDVLENLLLKGSAALSSTANELVVSLFELLVGRLVAFDASSDSGEPSTASKKLLALLESLLQTAGGENVDVATSTAALATIKGVFNAQFSCVAVPSVAVPVQHSVCFALKRPKSNVIDTPIMLENLTGKVVMKKTSEGFLQGATGVIIKNTSENVQVKFGLKEETFPYNVDAGSGDIAVIDANLKSTLFSKGAQALFGNCDKKVSFPAVVYISAVLQGNGTIGVSYCFDKERFMRFSSTFVPPETWVNVEIRFDTTGALAIVIDGEIVNAPVLEGVDWSTIDAKEAKEAGPRSAWYIGQIPVFALDDDSSATDLLNGGPVLIRDFEVFSSPEDAATGRKVNADEAKERRALEEPLLIRRLSLLRRAVENLGDFAELALKRHFSTSQLLPSLFDMMQNGSALVRTGAYVVAASILPQLDAEVVDGHATRFGLLGDGSTSFIDFLLVKIGKEVNVWSKRVNDIGNPSATAHHADNFSKASVVNAMLNLIRNFALCSNVSWSAAVHASLKKRVKDAIETIASLKEYTNSAENLTSASAIFSDSKSRLPNADHIFTLLLTLNGQSSSLHIGADVLYINRENGSSDEGVYLGMVDEPANVTKPVEGGYAALFIAHKGYEVNVVPRAELVVHKQAKAKQQDFAKFLETAFDANDLHKLFNAVISIDTVDKRPRPHAKVETFDYSEVFETPHPYPDSMNEAREIKVEGAESLTIVFDPLSATEQNCDHITFYADATKAVQFGDIFSGRQGSQNFPGSEGRPPLVINQGSTYYFFHSDGSVNDWGVKFTVTATGKRIGNPQPMLPAPAFGTLAQIKMMGLKALSETSTISPSVRSSLGAQLSQLLNAAVQPNPPHMISGSGAAFGLQPIVYESTHPYADNMDAKTTVKVDGATSYEISFDNQTATESSYDFMYFYADENNTPLPNSMSEVKYTGGRGGSDKNWPGCGNNPPITINLPSFCFYFHSDGSNNDWGYLMNVKPIGGSGGGEKSRFTRGTGFNSTLAENCFSVLQAVLSDGLALPSDSSFFNGEGETETPVVTHERNVAIDSSTSEASTTTTAQPTPADFKVNEFMLKAISRSEYTISLDSIEVRDFASATADVVTTLLKDTPVNKMQEQKDWIQISWAEIESGWVPRVVNDKFVLQMASVPFVGFFYARQVVAQEAAKSSSTSSAGQAKMNPMYAVAESTEAQAATKSLVIRSITDKALLHQDFSTIDEAINDYAIIASNEYAREMVYEALVQQPQQSDVSIQGLLTYMNINLAELKNVATASIPEAEASKRINAAFKTIMSSKNGEDYPLAKSAVDYTMAQVRATFSSASDEKAAPVVRGFSMVIESAHPYDDNMDKIWPVSIPGAKRIELTFDPLCSTETNCDYLQVFDDASKSTKLYEPKIHGFASGEKHWPGVDRVPKLVIERDSFVLNMMSDGSRTDWGFKVIAAGVFDAPTEAEEKELVAAAKKAAAEVDRKLQLAIWFIHKLCLEVDSLPAAIASSFFTEENLKSMKKLYLSPSSQPYLDQVVLILATFMTQLTSQLADNEGLMAEFIDLEASVISILRTRFSAETNDGTNNMMISPFFQTATQLVVSLQRALTMAASSATSKSRSDGKRVVLSPQEIGSAYALRYDAPAGGKDVSHWEVEILKNPVPKIGLALFGADGKPSLTLLLKDGDGFSVNDSTNAQIPVSVKNLEVGDIVAVSYWKISGTLQICINGAQLPVLVGPAAALPLIEADIKNLNFSLVTIGAGSENYECLVRFRSSSENAGTTLPAVDATDKLNLLLAAATEVDSFLRSMESNSFYNKLVSTMLVPHCSRALRQSCPISFAGEESFERVFEAKEDGASHMLLTFSDLQLKAEDALEVYGADGQLLAQITSTKRAEPKEAVITEKETTANEIFDISQLGNRLDPSLIVLTVAGDVEGGGTGLEFARNLHNDGTEDWNKWVQPGYVTESNVAMELMPGLSVNLSGYSICSANDCPGRDPVAWRLRGLVDGDWETLHSVEVDNIFTDRWQWRTFKLPIACEVTSVCLEITRVRSPGDGLQLGHLHLYAEDPAQTAHENADAAPVSEELASVKENKEAEDVTTAAPALPCPQFGVYEVIMSGSPNKPISNAWTQINAVGFQAVTATSTTTSTVAITVGSKVVRNMLWAFGDEDGGSGCIGTVTSLKSWEGVANAAYGVKWDNNNDFEGIYRASDLALFQKTQENKGVDIIAVDGCLRISGGAIKVIARFGAAAEGFERKFNCHVYPILPRKVCLQDQRFEPFRKTLKNVFALSASKSSQLAALVKHIDNTVNSNGWATALDKRWIEFTPSAEELVRSAPLKELVEMEEVYFEGEDAANALTGFAMEGYTAPPVYSIEEQDPELAAAIRASLELQAQLEQQQGGTETDTGNKNSAVMPGKNIKPVDGQFMVLQQFNSMLANVLPLINLSQQQSASLAQTISRHRNLIFNCAKMPLFESIITATNVNSGTFELVLSRSRAIKYAAAGKSPDLEGSWSVFGQAFRAIHPMHPSALRRADRLYSTKFMGEHAIDAGGPYRESFDTYTSELQSDILSLFKRTPNGLSAVGFNREKWILNPGANSRTELEMLAFLGKLMGIAIRSKQYLALNIPSIIWKLLAGDTPSVEDLEAIDFSLIKSLKQLVEDPMVNADNFSDIFYNTFTTTSIDNREVELIPGGAEIPVIYENRLEYRDKVLAYRLHEFDAQAEAVRSGLATIVPTTLLSLFTWEQLEEMVCGKAEIDVTLLKRITEYSSCSPQDQHIQFFWSAMEEFTNEERSAMLRFCWGRSRLPLNEAGFSQRLKIQGLNKQPADAHLPEAHTCFFMLDLPQYSSLEIMKERLRYAIFNSAAIDGDDGTAGMQVAEMTWET